LSLTNRNKYEICQTTFVLIPVTVSKNLWRCVISGQWRRSWHHH
jgi:hypothetical protein